MQRVRRTGCYQLDRTCPAQMFRIGNRGLLRRFLLRASGRYRSAFRGRPHPVCLELWRRTLLRGSCQDARTGLARSLVLPPTRRCSSACEFLGSAGWLAQPGRQVRRPVHRRRCLGRGGRRLQQPEAAFQRRPRLRLHRPCRADIDDLHPFPRRPQPQRSIVDEGAVPGRSPDTALCGAQTRQQLVALRTRPAASRGVGPAAPVSARAQELGKANQDDLGDHDGHRADHDGMREHLAEDLRQPARQGPGQRRNAQARHQAERGHHVLDR